MKKTIKVDISQEEINSMLLQQVALQYPNLPIELSIDGVLQGTFGYETSIDFRFETLKVGDVVTIAHNENNRYGDKGDKGTITQIDSIESIKVQLTSGKNRSSVTNRPFSELAPNNTSRIVKLSAEPSSPTLFVPTL